MVCEELDQLEWDFLQARAESLDIDSLGGRGIKANAAFGIKYHSGAEKP